MNEYYSFKFPSSPIKLFVRADYKQSNLMSSVPNFNLEKNQAMNGGRGEAECSNMVSLWSHSSISSSMFSAAPQCLDCFSFDRYHEWVIKRLAEKLCRRMEWPGPGQCLSTVSGCWPQPPEEGGAGHEKSVRTSSRSDLMLGLGWSRVTVTSLIFISPSYLSTLSHTF